MTYRLLALDLDGTVLDEEFRVSTRVRRAMVRAEAGGTRVTLASGRGYPSMRPWARELGIYTPLVSYQGAVVTDTETDLRLYERTFSLDVVGDLIGFCRERDLSLTLYADDEIFVENKQHSDAFYDQWFGLPTHVVGDLNTALSAPPVKCIIVSTDVALLDGLRPEMEAHLGDRLQVVRSHRFFLEGLALGASKGAALAWLCDHLGIAQAETMAIGDSGNDRAMIAWAGLGVAMGNASDEAKAAADHITDTVENDGAAIAIERYCLRE